jgi:hypothetical protein
MQVGPLKPFLPIVTWIETTKGVESGIGKLFNNNILLFIN